MDAICDPTVLEMYVMKSAQVGWTEALLNAVGYYMSQDPSPIFMVQPTLDMAETWSKDRLAPMIRDTPLLTSLVGDAKSRSSGNTLLHKQYVGGHIVMAGANSPKSLAGRPMRVILCDDIDRFPAAAGTEGDPLDLARKRSITFWNARLLVGSTPTIKGSSRIEIGFEASDKRRFFVPCPHCQAMQVLEWKFVRWPEGDPGAAHYVCPECDGNWDEAQRKDAVRRGEWRATAPFRGTAGFHIWEAYSPWRSLGQIAKDFVRAKEHPELLKVWVNTTLGETWEDRDGERMQAEELSSRAEEYEPWTAPEGAVMVTAGVDVQHDRLEVGVYAFGPGEECWTIAQDVISGSPKDAATWSILDDVLGKRIRRTDGMALPIVAVCVDASDGQTHGFVLDYCRTRRQRGVIAIKGQGGSKPPIGRPTKVDVTTRGQPAVRGAELWPVGVDTVKGVLSARLKEEGFIHFPAGMDPSYYEQMTAERLITKFRNGIPYKVWDKKSSERNEAWDCAVYAYAAACFAGLKRALWSVWRGRLKAWRDRVPTEELPAPEVIAKTARPKRRYVGLGSEDWGL